MLPGPSLVTLFVAPLHQLGVEYMVTGGLASIVYGEPRMTLDIDLVLQFDAAVARQFGDVWPAAEFYVPPLEVLLEESRRPQHGHFNISHHDTGLRADIYIAGDDALNAWALQRAVIRPMDGVAVRVAPIEAVILGKLRYFKVGGSDRHLWDINRMVRVSSGAIDMPALDGWLERLGFAQEWAAAQTFSEPV